MYWDMNLDVFLANWKFKGKSFPMKMKTSHDLVVDLLVPPHYNILIIIGFDNLSIFRLRRFLILLHKRLMELSIFLLTWFQPVTLCLLLVMFLI